MILAERGYYSTRSASWARTTPTPWRGKFGDPEAALAGFLELLPDRQLNPGADHEHALRTHQQVADWRAATGDTAGAIAEYAAVLDNHSRMLGADIPDAVETRELLQAQRDAM